MSEIKNELEGGGGGGGGDEAGTATTMMIDPPSPFSLPKRSTRGKRLAELVGDELEEDEEFWSSDKWNDEDDDDDFDEGDSDNEEYAAALDDADSDFDKPEEEDEAIIQEEDIVRLQKEEKKKEQRKKGAYVDPALKKRKEAKKAKGAGLSIRSAAQQASEIVEGSKPPSRTRSRSRLSSGDVAPTIQLRDSTRSVTAKTEAKQERERELAERRKQQHQQKAKAQAEKPPMTQDERLAEAVATEEINRNLLEQMLAVFEEKKQSQQFVRKKTVIGVGVTYVSKTVTDSSGNPCGRSTITFPDELPGVIMQKPLGPRKRKRPDPVPPVKPPPTVKYDDNAATLNHYMEEISMLLDEKKRKVDELTKRKKD